MNQRASDSIDHKESVSREDIRALRARITAIERSTAHSAGSNVEVKKVLPLGLAEIDQRLPEGGLLCGAVHEVSGSAVDGFVSWLAGRLVRNMGGVVLWCVRSENVVRLYGQGLAALGLDVGQLIIVRSRSRSDMLWAMEEGLRCSSFAAVITEYDKAISFSASRRLQLAAEVGGTTGFIIWQNRIAAAVDHNELKLTPSTYSSCWEVNTFPTIGWCTSGRDKERSIGELSLKPESIPFRARVRWQVRLKRCRGGGGFGTWLVENDETTCDFSLVATLGNRSAKASEKKLLTGQTTG